MKFISFSTILLRFAFLFISSNLSAQSYIWIISPELDSLTQENLNKDEFRVYVGDKMGYFSGSLHIPIHFDDLKKFNHGYVYTANGSITEKENATFSSADVPYTMILRERGMMITCIGNKVGLHYITGREILECIYDKIEEFEFNKFKVYKAGVCSVFNLVTFSWAGACVQKKERIIEMPAEQDELPIMLDDVAADRYEDLRGDPYGTHKGMSAGSASPTKHIEQMRFSPNIEIRMQRAITEAFRNFSNANTWLIKERLSPNLYSFQSTESRSLKGILRLSPAAVLAEPIFITVSMKGNKIVGNNGDGLYSVMDSATGAYLISTFSVLNKGNIFDRDSVFTIRQGTKLGLLSSELNLLVPVDYDSINRSMDPDIMFLVKGAKREIFNRKLARVSTTNFDRILFAKTDPLIVEKENVSYTYDVNEDKLSALDVKEIVALAEGDSIAVVRVKKNKVRLFDIRTQQFRSEAYDDLHFPTSRNAITDRKWLHTNRYIPEIRTKEFFVARLKNKCALLDHSGIKIFGFNYDSIHIISDQSRLNRQHYGEIFLLYHGKFTTVYASRLDEELADYVEDFVKETGWRSQHYYWYKQDGKWGVFSLGLPEIVRPFCDTVISYDATHVYRDAGKYGYITTFKTGGTFFTKSEPDYDSILFEGYYKALLHTINDEGKHGLLTHKGKLLYTNALDSVYSTVVQCNNYMLPVVFVKQDNLYGYVTEAGRLTVSPVMFDAVKIGGNGLRWVKFEGKWGIIDETYMVIRD